MMAVHMNDCVPNIFLPCFCISYLIMLVTTTTKITKPQRRHTVVFIAHMSGVSRELAGALSLLTASLTGMCTQRLFTGLDQAEQG